MAAATRQVVFVASSFGCSTQVRQRAILAEEAILGGALAADVIRNLYALLAAIIMEHRLISEVVAAFRRRSNM